MRFRPWWFVVLTLLFAGCDTGGESNSDARLDRGLPAQPIPLRLGLPGQPSGALLYIALARGSFGAAGLAVEASDYPSGKRALHEGLLAGQADLISSTEVPVALFGLEHLGAEPAPDPGPRILASIFSTDDVNRVVTRASLGIQRPEDLAGRRIATQRASAVHFFWHLFSLEHGIHDPEGLRFMPAEELPTALAEGAIDAFSMREPFVSQARDQIGDDLVVFAAPGLYAQRELLIVADDFAAEHPDAPRRVIHALLDAERFAQREPAAAARLVADRLGVAARDILALWPHLDLHVRLDQGLLLLLEEEARWAMHAGLVHGKGPTDRLPNYLDLIDSAPLETEQPAAVTLIR
ncbi:ABC transporter substrate-binding protein [Thiococcus pfennigii]|uniref:ABC transporter substrate-binding protein n=1 Tax=Thiococcus pfennigii TaxID=1057 RepID=UPI0019045209|nr:ABC transporter substrate-binding protein [Thiococcus pfennigii]